MYRTISNDIRELFSPNAFDIICFFTPSGVKSLFDNFPHFKQNGTLIGAFGTNTSKAAEDAGLVLEIKAPEPAAPIYGVSFGKIPCCKKEALIQVWECGSVEVGSVEEQLF